MGRTARTYEAIFYEPAHAEDAAIDLVKADMSFTYEVPGKFRFKINKEVRAIRVFTSGKPKELYREPVGGGPWHSVSLDGCGVERE